MVKRPGVLVDRPRLRIIWATASRGWGIACGKGAAFCDLGRLSVDVGRTGRL